MSESQSSSVLIKFSMCGRGGCKLEINIPPQQIYANSKGGLIIKGGVMSSEYGMYILGVHVTVHASRASQ